MSFNSWLWPNRTKNNIIIPKTSKSSRLTSNSHKAAYFRLEIKQMASGAPCNPVQPEFNEKFIVQDRARSCKIVQLHATPCKTSKFNEINPNSIKTDRARSCKIVQDRATSCNFMQTIQNSMKSTRIQ